MSVGPSRELLVFDSSWPPAIIIRRRSRRISLRLDSSGGLRVNAPTYISRREIKDFIIKNKDWADKQRRRSEQTFKQLSGDDLGDFIKIQHEISTTLGVSAREQQLNLKHPSEFIEWAELYEQGRGTVKRLVNKQAKVHLLPEASQIASHHKPQPTAIKLRYMRSRWGSCHPKGIITLNSQLVRLPQELRHYVILHELTHLSHPHHQPNFWAALETKIGPVKRYRTSLRNHTLWY